MLSSSLAVFNFFLFNLFFLLVNININYGVEAVNLARYGKLSKEEFLELDREATAFFSENYQTLDSKNVTYDEILFRSIRALRHTVVMNHFDYKYTNDEIVKNSQGAVVNDELCLEQLKMLVEFSKARQQITASPLPLTVINFLESYGKTEAGMLNGNILWTGSYASCQRAYIPAQVIKNFGPINRNERSNISESAKGIDLKGRFCYSHLRAHDWPKDDKYFEDRINIKVAVCLPETCHTKFYLESAEVRKYVDYLGRNTLSDPFNSERYTIEYLYCLPDEDSVYRQWDLGTKLFIIFVSTWALILIYANWKYSQRLTTIKRLRESVDIRMIIRQKRDETYEGGEKSDEIEDDHDNERAHVKKTTTNNEKRHQSSSSNTPTSKKKQLENLKAQVEGAELASRSSRVSGNEEDGSDISVIRSIVSDSKRASSSGIGSGAGGAKKNPSNQTYSSQSKGVDFIKAFSLQSNLNYLLRTREQSKSKLQSSEDLKKANKHKTNFDAAAAKRLSQQLSAVDRRTSASNESLFRDLQGNELVEDELNGKTKTGRPSQDNQAKKQLKDGKIESKSKEPIRRQDTTNSESVVSSPKQMAVGANKRVNLDILDGIKVLATCWIVYGHTLMFFFGIVTDLRFGDERMYDFTMLAAFNTLHVVSLFYIITGTLLTYLAFSRQKKSQLLKPGFWVLVFIGRYIRLLPVYFLVFWFARHVSPYVGSGILFFDYRTDDEHVRGQCKHESWWVMLTMSAADVKIPFDCVPQSWYLSNDTRTLFILPIYIIILAINQNAGYVAILSTFAFSWYRLTQILRVANIDYTVIIHWKPHVYSILADRLHDVYTDLMVRVSTYLMGVLVGHLIYRYEIGEIKRWPGWLNMIGMKLALIVATTFYMGVLVLKNPLINQFLPDPEDVHSDIVVILIPLFKTAMEICLCTVLLLMLSGGGYKIINDSLSGNCAKILSNISYAVFMLHVEFMYKIQTSKFESNYWALFIHAGFFIIGSNFIAFFVHILYEMPINNLLRQTMKLYKLTVK